MTANSTTNATSIDQFDSELCFQELKRDVAFSLALLVGIIQVRNVTDYVQMTWLRVRRVKITFTSWLNKITVMLDPTYNDIVSSLLSFHLFVGLSFTEVWTDFRLG